MRSIFRVLVRAQPREEPPSPFCDIPTDLSREVGCIHSEYWEQQVVSYQTMKYKFYINSLIKFLYFIRLLRYKEEYRAGRPVPRGYHLVHNITVRRIQYHGHIGEDVQPCDSLEWWGGGMVRACELQHRRCCLARSVIDPQLGPRINCAMCHVEDTFKTCR